ncbi:MAG: hypothetical protein ACT4PM_06950 [Gemmatimonadales bacterium]
MILSAQTALPDAIGKHDLPELIQSRVELGHGLKVALAEKMVNWGFRLATRDGGTEAAVGPERS